MKKLFSFLFFLSIAFTAHAQTHDGMYFQGAARNANGNILANTPIQLRYSIHDSVANGVVVYQETFSTTTSAQGMFNVIIGKGTVVSGNFSNINWGTNEKFVQTEMATNGNNFMDMGTKQMMSVPYALHAKIAEDVKLSVSQIGDTLKSGSNNFIIVPGISAANYATPTLYVGMNYGGGVVAYILQQGDLGYNPFVQHGIIAAPYDQGNMTWGCSGTLISGADGSAIGTGSQNTFDIVTGCTSLGIAARVCDDLMLNGYSDWYLPSIDELQKLYLNRNLIGGFLVDGYWSSTETQSTSAIVQDFANGGQNGNYNKMYYRAVRAIRSF